MYRRPSKDYLTISVMVLAASVLVLTHTSGSAGAWSSHSCHLGIQQKVFPAYYDGEIRENPDGTYYPGDAFYFLFVYREGSHCSGHSLTLNQYGNAMIVESKHTIPLTREDPGFNSKLTRTGKDIRFNSYDWRLDYTDSDNDLIIPEHVRFRTPSLFGSLDKERQELILERGNHSGGVMEQIQQYCESGNKKCVYGRVEILATDDVSSCDEFLFENISLEGKRIIEEYSRQASPNRSTGWNFNDWVNPLLPGRQEPAFYDGRYSDVELFQVYRYLSAFDLINNTSSEDFDEDDDTKFVSMRKPTHRASEEYKKLYNRYITIDSIVTPNVITSKFADNYKAFLDTELSDEKIFCVDNPTKIELKLSATYQRHDTDKYGERIHVSFQKIKTSTILPDVLDPKFDILFKYPALLDSDALPAKNNDGTYYTDDPAAVVRYPDVLWAEERWPLITFTEHDLSLSRFIQNHFSHDCDDARCLVNMTYPGIYHQNPISYVNGYGSDVFSIHNTARIGEYIPTYNMSMYNLGDEVASDVSSGYLLFVKYLPVLSAIHSWSNLDDGGNTSLENRNALGIQYDGSIGGGPNDGTESLHPQRRAKLNHISYNASLSDGFQTVIAESYNGTITNVNDIQNMSIYPSVSQLIPAHLALSGESYQGESLMSPLYNNTAIVFYSQGHSRILIASDLPEELVDDGFVGVAVNHTLSSVDFAGIPTTHLGNHTYQYPFGYFSTPLNLTAYVVSSETGSTAHCDEQSDFICVPKDIIHNDIDYETQIGDVSFATNREKSFLGFPEFLIHSHRANDIPEPFSIMILSDVYKFNTPQNLDASTGVVLLNKTGIHYDLKYANDWIDFELDGVQRDITDAANHVPFNSTIGEAINYTSTVSDEDLLQQSYEDFFTSYMVHDVTISAKRNELEKTNVVEMNPAGKQIVHYRINMHPENHLEHTRTSMMLGTSATEYFGDGYEVYVDGQHFPKQGQFSRYDNNVCSGNECAVRLGHEDPVDVTAENIWGGRAQGKGVAPPDIPDFEMDWDLASFRFLYIGAGIIAVMLGYVFVKKFAKSFSSK